MIKWNERKPGEQHITSTCDTFKIQGIMIAGSPEYIANVYPEPDSEMIVGIGKLDECKQWCESLLNLSKRVEENVKKN